MNLNSTVVTTEAVLLGQCLNQFLNLNSTVVTTEEQNREDYMNLI